MAKKKTTKNLFKEGDLKRPNEFISDAEALVFIKYRDELYKLCLEIKKETKMKVFPVTKEEAVISTLKSAVQYLNDPSYRLITKGHLAGIIKEKNAKKKN